jgi:hypothetical protein
MAEDLVQETGLRLIRMWPQIDQAKPIWPLTATIALNLFRDELRRSGSKESVQTLPDAPSIENVEERGMARVELRAVGGALAQMSDAQRAAILSDLSAESDATPMATSARMVRMRARRRLQHLLDHASALGVALGLQMRRAIREIELVISRVLPTDAERATATVVSLLAAISFGVAVIPPSGGRAEAKTQRSSTNALSPSKQLDDSYLASATTTGAMTAGSGQRLGGNGELGRRGGNGRSGSAGGSRPGGDVDEVRDLPAPTYYQVWVNEDTYARGEVELDVMGTGDPNRSGDSSVTPGSVACSFAPSHTGASCTASENGTENRGVRAEHRGDAKVAGQHVP